MIVVDTSAIIAAILNESSHRALARKLFSERDRICSSVTHVEAVMVLSRTYSDPRTVVDAYLQKAGIAVSPVDAEQTQWAIQAFLFYGKGRNPARLNLGDCFSYAAAKAFDARLLYVGDDFSKTDIRSA